MSEKAPKPYPLFPLFPHSRGYWCKKINNKQVPFGPWAWPDPEAYEASWKKALNSYNEYLEDRAHGRLTVAKGSEITARELVDYYLAYQHDRTAGKIKEISAVYFAEVRAVTTAFRDYVGADTTIEQLEVFDPGHPNDCIVVQWINEQKTRFGWHAYNKRVSIMSGLFTWAEDPVTGVLRRPYRLKSFFAKREDLLRRREKRIREETRGKQRWTGLELRGFFGAARNPVRAMLGLMYFAGFGLSDCSDLPIQCVVWKPDKSLALPEGWGIVNFQRPKTEIDRAAVLPPFVMTDLQECLDTRPEPIVESLAGRLFLTPFGNPWVRDVIYYDPNVPDQILRTVRADAVGQEFRRLRDRLSHCEKHGWITPPQLGAGFRSDKKRKGEPLAPKRPKALKKCPTCGKVAQAMRKLGAYTFRHTATTYASGVADGDARALFEGHSIGGVRKMYVEEIDTHKLFLIAQRLLEKTEIPPDGGTIIKRTTQNAGQPSEPAKAPSDGKTAA